MVKLEINTMDFNFVYISVYGYDRFVLLFYLVI